MAFQSAWSFFSSEATASQSVDSVNCSARSDKASLRARLSPPSCFLEASTSRRRVRPCPPSHLELTMGFGRGRQLGLRARLFLSLQRRDDGFSHRDELFLLLNVGKSAPIVHITQLVYATRHHPLQRAQGRNGFT